MSGNFWLDWAALAISLFNTILLVWLGLIVLLAAERRNWGVWLAGEGLLVGAAFFVSHSAILGQTAANFTQGINFWWHLGWWPVVASPFAWYILMLWFTGFWDAAQSALHRRHLPWLVFSILFTLLLVGLMLFANPLPNLSDTVSLEFERVPSIGNIPLLFLGYPFYIVVCILLALDALLRPAPSSRVLGDVARRRARPWLVATSFVLLLVSLVVGMVLIWIVIKAQQYDSLAVLYAHLLSRIVWFDLLLAAMISISIILLGQAVVSYEIFTGRILPRRGFMGQWRNAIVLAAGSAILVSWSLTIQLQPIYIVLLVLFLMTFFYALFSWRVHVERDQTIHQLRPFVTSQHLYEHFLTSGQSVADLNLEGSLKDLCNEVLGAKRAVLVPMGTLAGLNIAPIFYPDTLSLKLPSLASLVAMVPSPQTIGAPLDPDQYNGLAWVVPLWGERGLNGLFLIGEKRDGGFYSLEEIEIARASGERMIDIQASVEITRRLIALQRQRLVETQVVDRNTRRVLHDDVLPRLHAAMITLSSASRAANQETINLLSELHHRVADLLHEMPSEMSPDVAKLGLIGALRQVLSNELASAFDAVNWQISPEVDQKIKRMLPLETDVVYYAAREVIRNAACHARPSGSTSSLHINLRIDWNEGLEITIEDDGVGMVSSNMKTRGNGKGLALHSTMMAVVGGSLALESEPGAYTRVILHLPVGSSE